MIHRLRWLSRSTMAGAAVAALVAGMVLAGCGGTSSTAATTPTDTTAPAPTATTAAAGGATITMGAFTFSQASATVKAGQAVTFNDPSSSGGTHILVTGHNGTFTAQAGAPTEFATATGLSFSPGDTKTVVFPTAGTYTITCTIHHSMLATITVTA